MIWWEQWELTHWNTFILIPCLENLSGTLMNPFLHPEYGSRIGYWQCKTSQDKILTCVLTCNGLAIPQDIMIQR